MIYTVTLNPAIDKTAVISNFTAGVVNRIAELRTDVGGKGINVSKCLCVLGLKSVAAVLTGGNTGNEVLEYLEKSGIETISVETGGNTRTNLKIIDNIGKQNTDINEPGTIVTPEIAEKLKQKIAERAKTGDIILLSGSIPPGLDSTLYYEWIKFFRDKGITVFLDADGENLKLGVKALPHLIKPNGDELGAMLGEVLDNDERLIKASRRLLDLGIEDIVVSLGSKGALYMNKDGVYKADAVRVQAKSSVGAGDSVMAVLAYAKETGLSREDTIRLSSAIGAASVTCSGTQPPSKVLIDKLFGRVSFRKL